METSPMGHLLSTKSSLVPLIDRLNRYPIGLVDNAKLREILALLFDPRAPGVALKPSVAALNRAVALLSGTEAVRGQDPATDEVFRAPDALGWVAVVVGSLDPEIDGGSTMPQAGSLVGWQGSGRQLDPRGPGHL